MYFGAPFSLLIRSSWLTWCSLASIYKCAPFMLLFIHSCSSFLNPPLRSNTLPYTPIRSLILSYAPLCSLTLPYTPIRPLHSLSLLYASLYSLTLPYALLRSLTLSYASLCSLTLPYTPLRSFFFSNAPLCNGIPSCALWFFYPARTILMIHHRLLLSSKIDCLFLYYA